MLQKIIQFSIRNRFIVLLGVLALILWGSYAVSKIPIDAVPDITNNQVQVLTTSPSLAAQEVERLITFPVEQTMATIPHIREMRSISRFGLSVVTIVFEDDADIYWARQQISERLPLAKAQIPDGVGNPELAPVTTGLGEIYQYTLKVKQGYEQQYSLARLRSIQDWLIRRQLLGIPGVADVSSFGGYLKQYEIAINPEKLRSMNLGMDQVFRALAANNQNTGGAYIESGPAALFVRSEGLVGSIGDIEQIAVAHTAGGIPVLIRDIGIVREGHATRYGAMTYNDKRETAGGIVLMLKGANSSQVIKKVKERVQSIQKTLPEGVLIEPYLDRTELVNRAISTVEKNLLEGALIVVFVLVLFLGNLRAGLLVSSVIPLSMLFALGMMNLFGVSGNLMSLGAIDFGLIVDGAVIVVEAIMHFLHDRLAEKKTDTLVLDKEEMNEAVGASATRMMNAAVFGQIIILIVYLPILSLVGTEGRMFRPMAQTVGFAIIGALLLSVTYVPMMSAWVLSRKTSRKESLADKIMNRVQRWYTPALGKVLKYRLPVLGASLLLLLASVVLFLNMGGEFLPQLEEGDFAVETRLVTGSSLSESIAVSKQAAAILKREFPEVKKVIGKIGTSEIPTDPMPMEASDLIVVLKDKKEWTSASDRQELADKMSEALNVLPQASFGFQQPIQMRFNELMAGARQDVAVMIYGDNLDSLSRLARQAGHIAAGIRGAADVYVEQVTGLPQIVVQYNRPAIARFGLSIGDVNKALEAAFAGAVAGTVYEGEQRYDLVVRLDSQNRRSPEDVRNLPVLTAGGIQVPLAQLANISVSPGPNQIQRESAQRRILVGFNVRGRDVESIVNELEEKMNAGIRLPAGYHIGYGGQFQNLVEAKSRLAVAVPAALALIFLLLFFAFRSVPEALLIFTAIPFAAIGGVFALLLRGMPFSISAGVGFIALFGVAVLNGIVLISEFRRLKRSGMTDTMSIVREGTRARIRPVLMTACVASLGFLPMALSNTSGAEVQKPLATVVIGGLVSSTLLTLFVLPVLYTYMESWSRKFRLQKSAGLLLLLLISLPAVAQQDTVFSWKQCVDIALQRNQALREASFRVQAAQARSGSAFDPGNTTVRGMFGQYNSYSRKDNNISISQSVPFPGQVMAQKKVFRSEQQVAEGRRKLAEHELVYALNSTILRLQMLHMQRSWYAELDSLYSALQRATALRVKTGEAPPAEKLLAEARYQQLDLQQKGLDAEEQKAQASLEYLVQYGQPFAVARDTLQELDLPLDDTATLRQHPLYLGSRAEHELAKAEQQLERQKMLPGFSLGYFNQTLIGTQAREGSTALAGPGDRFQGFEAGLSLPLFFGAQKARIRVAESNIRASEARLAQQQAAVYSGYRQALAERERQQARLAYYRSTALPQALLLKQQSWQAFRAGEMEYSLYLQSLETIARTHSDYLDALYQYNQSILDIAYHSGILFIPVK